MSNTEWRLPEIGEYVQGDGTLVGVQEVVPPPPPVDKDYIFEEITARVELLFGSEVLNEICTLWDAYGKETSVKAAIEEAKRYVADRKIGPWSGLEVVVSKIVGQVRKRPTMDDRNPYNRTFCSFERLPTGSRANLPGSVETVVWTSKETKSKEQEKKSGTKRECC